MKKIKVGISIGDLNGIGSEIVLKTFAESMMLELCTPVIFANTGLLNYVKRHFNLKLNFQGISKASDAIDGKINVVNVWRNKVKINFGEEDKSLGEYTLTSLTTAVEALKKQEIDILVTAPINKNVIQSDKFNFPGHTDYLAKELGGESLMFMVGEKLKVGLLTDHVPIKDIANTITPELIKDKVRLITTSLQQDFRVQKPKIAVLGINPHSGDKGVIGKEDEQVLKPTIRALNDQGVLVYGPYAADSFFGTKNYENFDAILAAYHDQGLIPFKTLSFGHGVNFTAGLTEIHTPPDHGTAYEIAGKGKADFESFRKAVYLGIDVFRARKEYKELTANPLPISKSKGRKKYR